jgi:hypothetical protein
MLLKAVINWGDGQTTQVTPTLTSINGSTASFIVTGTHTYLTTGVAGSYPVTVTIFDPSGQTATANSTALVLIPNPTPTSIGGLANVVTNGPHAARGYTNTNRPTFTGTAPPFSIVQLDARHFNVDAELPLGEAVATSTGQWTLTTGPLAAGIYIVAATITPPGGYPSNMFELTNANGKNLVFIDLSPALARRLSHSKRPISHPKIVSSHPKIPKPLGSGHHKL